MKVAVLRGGWSLERSVSLRSGGRIEGALRAPGHVVTVASTLGSYPVGRSNTSSATAYSLAPVSG